MSYVLRPYQAQAADRGVAFLKAPHGKHGVIVAPTASGKSLVIASMVKQLGEPALVFQPTKEILEQNATKLLGYGIEPAVYSASLNLRETGKVTLATIGSVKGSPEMFAGVKYVIVDECHLMNAKGGMYAEFFAALGNVKILGLTATPYRLSSDGYGGSMLKFLTRTRPRIFSEVVHFTQIPDLMAQGFLERPVYHKVDGFKRADLKFNTSGGDYDDASVRRHFNQIGFNDRVRRTILRLRARGRKKILVFVPFVDDAEKLVAGVPGAALVTGDTKDSLRRAIVSGFREADIDVVVNVNVLSIGFDFPELDTVVLARPTASLALFYQQVGRVLRPHPLKLDSWVVDMVDNVGYFGRVDDLWLRPGGNRGDKWEMVTRLPDGKDRPLTNVYFEGDEGVKRRQRGREHSPW